MHETPELPTSHTKQRANEQTTNKLTQRDRETFLRKLYHTPTTHSPLAHGLFVGINDINHKFTSSMKKYTNYTSKYICQKLMKCFILFKRKKNIIQEGINILVLSFQGRPEKFWAPGQTSVWAPFTPSNI